MVSVETRSISAAINPAVILRSNNELQVHNCSSRLFCVEQDFSVCLCVCVCVLSAGNLTLK